MTPGIGLALVAMACFGAGDLIYKRAAAHGVEPRQFVMWQAWVFCPSITIYAWLTGTLDPHLPALWGAAAGIASIVGFYNFARSLQGGAVSTNAPIFRLNFILTAALAIALLGEPLTLAKLGGLLGALLAVWLLLGERTNGGAHSDTSSLMRVLIATVAIALANFFYKLGLRGGALPETMVATQAWAFSSTATLFAWMRERRFNWTPGTWRYASPAAVLLLIGFVLLLRGLAVGPASVLVPVAQMGFVLTALLGAALFREQLSARKWIGLAVAVAALALFAFS
ncbi:MAG TPA: EamA family transporter [Pseudolabrys sp.]|nr:EamA family transporter [Pseudolabrys sp.]